MGATAEELQAVDYVAFDGNSNINNNVDSNPPVGTISSLFNCIECIRGNFSYLGYSTALVGLAKLNVDYVDIPPRCLNKLESALSPDNPRYSHVWSIF